MEVIITDETPKIDLIITEENQVLEMNITDAEPPVNIEVEDYHGLSAYQLYLLVTTDDPPMTLEEWLASLAGGDLSGKADVDAGNIDPHLPEWRAKLIQEPEDPTEEETASAPHSRTEDGWRTINNVAPANIVLGNQPEGSFHLTGTGDITAFTTKMGKFMWPGRGMILYTEHAVTLKHQPQQPTTNAKYFTFAEDFTTKPDGWYILKEKASFIEVVELGGGGAEFPEGNPGDVLVKGATEWEASDRLTVAESEIDAEVVNRAAADLTEKNERIAADALKVDKPTTDGIWSLQKLGSVFTWVAGVVQNIANTDLTNLSARIFTQGNSFTWDTAGFPYRLKNLIDKTTDLSYSKLIVQNPTTGDVATKTIGSDKFTLIHRYTHDANIVLLPESIDWATGYVTIANHGQSFSGQQRVGLFKRGLNANISLDTNLGRWIPDEYMATATYIKVIDANTLMICNSAGNLISVNLSHGSNTGINHMLFQIEIVKPFDFYFPEISIDYFRILVRGYHVGEGRSMCANYNSATSLFVLISATTRKNNLLSITTIDVFGSSNFKYVSGGGYGAVRQFDNSGYVFSEAVSTSGTTNASTAVTKVNRLYSNFSGIGVQPFQYANGSVIEIYK